MYHGTSAALVEHFNYAYNFLRDAVNTLYLPQRRPVRAIESFAEIDEINDRCSIGCFSFLYDLSLCEDVV